MRNQIEYTFDAFDQLTRLTAAASDPDEVERVAAQLEGCFGMV